MTPAQREEFNRLTTTMRAILTLAESRGWVSGRGMVGSANILARRGFIAMQRQPDGYYNVQLTKAGTEALALMPRPAQAYPHG